MKRRIQELYREQKRQKEMAKLDTKNILWIVVVLAITLLWIVLFDGQLTDERIIHIGIIE